MTTADRKLIETKLRRRHYVQPDVDPIKDAMIISDKVQKNGCFGAVVTGILFLITLVGMVAL